MSVASRLLIHVAVGAACVVAIVAGVTYRLVYQAAEQRAFEHLNTYVIERTQREEAKFSTVYSNLEVVRGQFLRRDEEPPPADVEARWDRRFVRYPDGAWRNREEFFSPRIFSNLWAHRDIQITPRRQASVLRAMEICEEAQVGWIDSFQSLYFILPGPLTMGFDPRIARWAWQTPADFDLEHEEWFLAGGPARNPARSFAWTGVYVDEMTGEPCVTVLLPIEKRGETLGMVAHDMHMDHIFDEVARSEFRGAQHIILGVDGRLIAHPSLKDAIVAGQGKLNAGNAGDPALAHLYALLRAETKRQFSGFEPVSNAYFSASRLPRAEWFYVTMMPRSIVQEQAFRSARWVWISGLASLALLLVSFAEILRRQISRPLAALTAATQAMSGGDTAARAEVHRADELGALAKSVNLMSSQVAAREADLRHLNASLERRVEERTDDLNAALARERELGEMKSNFVSLVSHEFRTPLGVIMSAADVLARYFDRLPAEKRARHLEMIFRSTRNLANLIEEVLLLGRVEEGRLHFAPVPVDLEKFCRSLADELISSTGGVCPIEFQARTSLADARTDESVLRHILCNLLSNAAKYSEPRQTVEFTAERDGENVVFTVRDRGIGIPEEDRARLFTSFSRARNVGARPGTGLGLVVVQRCVELHGGTVQIDSSVGVGTTATVALPVFGDLPTPPSPFPK